MRGLTGSGLAAAVPGARGGFDGGPGGGSARGLGGLGRGGAGRSRGVPMIEADVRSVDALGSVLRGHPV
jgi:hypothetical protein